MNAIVGPRYALTIGNFDGVHTGHRYLLDKLVTQANERGVESLVVTFEPHPVRVLRPEHAPPRISTPQDKLRHLRSAGIDQIVVLPFDLEFAGLSPDEFLEAIVTCAHPTDVFIGDGFRFGRARAGTVDVLTKCGRKNGFDTHIIQPLEDSNGVVSSSRIRTLLLGGNVEPAADLLGRRFRLRGVVEHGMARGRDLGFPTANVSMPESICVPADGIYVGYAHLDGTEYGPREALIYIGTSPTFGTRERLIEVYILDYRGDLYSRELEIEFLAFIRPDQKFDNSEALVQQMADDEARSRALLARSTPEHDVKGE